MSKVVKEILVSAKQLISDPNKWCQGAFAKDDQGSGIHPEDPIACQFCALGAVRVVSWSDHLPYATYIDVVQSLERCLPGNYRAVGPFNDASSHEEVMKLFDCAIAKEDSDAK